MGFTSTDIIYKGNTSSDRSYIKYAFFNRMIDEDNDSLPDYWEIRYFGDLSRGRNDDPDLDGFTNYEEFNNKTDPTQPDIPIPDDDNNNWNPFLIIILVVIALTLLLILHSAPKLNAF